MVAFLLHSLHALEHWPAVSCALHVWLAALLTHIHVLVMLIHFTDQPDHGKLLGDPVYLLCHTP